MRSIQLVGALLVIAGIVILFLLRGPLISLIFLLLEFVAIVIGIILVIVGIALLVGGRWVRRGFSFRI